MSVSPKHRFTPANWGSVDYLYDLVRSFTHMKVNGDLSSVIYSWLIISIVLVELILFLLGAAFVAWPSPALVRSTHIHDLKYKPLQKLKNPTQRAQIIADEENSGLIRTSYALLILVMCYLFSY